jgi:hypothetical protein
MFGLTDLGLEMAERILAATKDNTVKKSADRLPHYLQKEIGRILHLESFKFFTKGMNDKILDTDFYDYLDVTVRSPKNIFIGRLKTVEKACKDLEKIDQKKYKELLDFHGFMIDNFSEVISYISKLK